MDFGGRVEEVAGEAGGGAEGRVMTWWSRDLR
jgi:hypothetical protein